MNQRIVVGILALCGVVAVWAGMVVVTTFAMAFREMVHVIEAMLK